MNIFLDIIGIKSIKDLEKMCKVLDQYGFIWSGMGKKITVDSTKEYLEYSPKVSFQLKVPVNMKTRMRVTPKERELVELYRAFNHDLDKQEDLIKEKDMLVAKIENIQFDLKGKSDAIKELIEGEY